MKPTFLPPNVSIDKSKNTTLKKILWDGKDIGEYSFLGGNGIFPYFFFCHLYQDDFGFLCSSEWECISILTEMFKTTGDRFGQLQQKTNL